MRILLGVCGSIAAYKSYDLARALVKKGHQVRILLTKGALHFVQPEVYRYLGVEQVYLDQDDFHYPREIGQAPVLHIELARWAQRLAIAPLSANTLSQLAMGQANNLLTSVFLALTKEVPVLLFPAMNTQMLNHPFVQENFSLLKRFELHPNCFISPTDSGLLACGENGEGKLMDVAVIEEMIESLSPRPHTQAKKILITMGATKAKLDPVRFLTNPASGLTASLLALGYHRLGHHVTVIAGDEAYKSYQYLRHFPRIEMIKASTTEQMGQFVLSQIEQTDIYLSPAAIGDIEFNYHLVKVKKNEFEKSLPIRPAIDILKEVIKHKSPKLKIVGFAAETNLSDEILNAKLQSKPVDLLVATQVHQGDETQEALGFQVMNARYRLIKDGKEIFQGELSKIDLTQRVLAETLEC